MRTIIKNGMIVDGSGNKPYFSDIVIENDIIADIVPKAECRGDCVIDAGGKIVTPGFIDSHRHCDIAAISEPDFGKIELAQGITSALSGNCGLTPFPSTDSSRRSMYDFMRPCLGDVPESLKLYSFHDYAGMLEARRPCINIGGMIGTGAVKAAVKGYSHTPYTADEMARARVYMEEAMQNGAFGVSSGIMYIPECYSTVDEFAELLRTAAKYGAIWTCHIRGEGDSLVSSVEEVIEISRRTQLPLNISHFKAAGVKNWGNLIYEAIERIEASDADVTVDFYPYTGGATTLMTLLPPSVIRGNIADMLKEIATRTGIDKVKKELDRVHEGWDNMVASIGWERIVISSVCKKSNKIYTGRSIAEIVRTYGYSDPVDFMCELLCDEEGGVGIIVMSMSQEDVDAIARLPYSMLISDSLYGNMDSPHPRLYGSFPKMIREYVVERRILPIETAVYKMCGMTAARFGIRNRGRIAAGNYADINVFTLEEFKDRSEYSSPKQLSTGMQYVLLNGRLVWENQSITGCRSAVILKKER